MRRHENAPRRRLRTAPLRVWIALAFAAACTRERPFEKTHLVTLPDDKAADTITFSADATAWAFVTTTPDGERVVTAGGAGPPHTSCTRLAFAPESTRLFYWATDGPDDRRTVTLVADGAEHPTDYVAPGELVFSADGTRWIAIGGAPGEDRRKDLGELSLLADGREIARHRDLSLPAFSPDARQIAYLARTDAGVSLFIEGAARQTFERPTAPCAVAALEAAPQPDLPLRHRVQYLPDGSLLVLTRDADGWALYRDAERIASYPVSTIDRSDDACAGLPVLVMGSVRVAEAAPAVFWWERVAGEEERWRVVRNGVPVDDVTCVEPWRRHPPEPSADGTRVVYPCATTAANDVTSVYLHAGGARYGPYGDVWGIAPTTDGRHVAYGAAGDGDRPWSIYVDGEVRAGGFAAVWRPRVSDDGATVAWEATFDDPGESRGVFGIDDRPLGSFDAVLRGPDFEPEDRVSWIVRRGRRITRVTVPIALARRPLPGPVASP